MIKVIAIIVTFKRKELLSEVINAVLNQDANISEVLVIDNNSNDGTKELVETFMVEGATVVNYYNTGANLGGAGGFKFGIQKASERNPDYIWLMDDDLKPNRDCLRHLLHYADSKTICQPLRLNVDGSCAEYSPTIYDLKSPFILRPKRKTVIDCFNSAHDENIPLHGIPFEGPLIPAALVSDIGLPDDRFFIFYDDLDYSIRARKAGYAIKCIIKSKATRLLQNSQVQELASWKGYFMLRNFFRIHLLHGENQIVKYRPLLITTLYVIKEYLKGNKKTAQVCLDAYKDHKSRTFNITKKYIP